MQPGFQATYLQPSAKEKNEGELGPFQYHEWSADIIIISPLGEEEDRGSRIQNKVKGLES